MAEKSVDIATIAIRDFYTEQARGMPRVFFCFCEGRLPDAARVRVASFLQEIAAAIKSKMEELYAGK